MIVSVKVIPKSSCNKIVGWENGELKIKIAAPPDKGQANDALIAFLADCLDISKSSITLLRGDTARHKRLQIDGLSPEQFQQHIQRLHG